MKNKALLIVVATVFPLAIFLGSLAMMPKESPPAKAAENADEDDQLAAETKAIHRNIVALLRDAKSNYPVPFVRETLAKIFDPSDGKSVKLVSVYTDEPAYARLLAQFEPDKDGGARLLLYLNHITKSLESMMGNEDYADMGEVTDAEMQDWLVFFVLHEWFHYMNAHACNTAAVGQHNRQEADAWMDGFQNILIPAKLQGRFRRPLNETTEIGMLCYVKAHGDKAHPAWKAFIDWNESNGEIDETDICFDE
jgi:hypothetical protein